MARRKAGSGTKPARSTIVRATVVTGMPSWTVT
jgi:hypothetical protein